MSTKQTTVASFTTIFEAEQLVASLTAQGIDAMVFAQPPDVFNPLFQFGGGLHDVRVAPEDLEKVRQLIESERPQREALAAEAQQAAEEEALTQVPEQQRAQSEPERPALKPLSPAAKLGGLLLLAVTLMQVAYEIWLRATATGETTQLHLGHFYGLIWRFVVGYFAWQGSRGAVRVIVWLTPIPLVAMAAGAVSAHDWLGLAEVLLFQGFVLLMWVGDVGEVRRVLGVVCFAGYAVLSFGARPWVLNNLRPLIGCGDFKVPVGHVAVGEWRALNGSQRIVLCPSGRAWLRANGVEHWACWSVTGTPDEGDVTVRADGTGEEVIFAFRSRAVGCVDAECAVVFAGSPYGPWDSGGKCN